MIKGQLERDQAIVKLVDTMVKLYSFVDALRDLPGKIELLEDIITNILKQTVECSIFIREYSGKGFGGALFLYLLHNIFPHCLFR